MTYFSFDKSALALMPKRERNSNKGSFGRVLCVCGSEGMAGAAYLSAKAAYRTGAGLVEILTHRVNLPVIQTLIPEAVVSVYDEAYDKNKIIASLERADCIVIGCGLGQSILSRTLLSDVLRGRREGVPLIIDADGLNLLAKNPSLWKYAKGGVVTPHALEMSRITGIGAEEILANKAEIAREFAEKHSLICVLKDSETVVSDGGEDIYINKRGNSGMATGGSGDVLSGIIGGILCQSVKKGGESDSFRLAALGVYIHSVAGDVAAADLGEYSVMAGDIADRISEVLKRI